MRDNAKSNIGVTEPSGNVSPYGVVNANVGNAAVGVAVTIDDSALVNDPATARIRKLYVVPLLKPNTIWLTVAALLPATGVHAPQVGVGDPDPTCTS